MGVRYVRPMRWTGTRTTMRDLTMANRDMGSLQSALFAIVYRYCVREDDDNEMLNMGVM